jgi:hypothetical protein
MLTTALLTTSMLTTAMLTTAMLTAGMPDCPASSQSGTGLRKTNDAGTDPSRNKTMQSGIFLMQYRTEMKDAG